MHELVDVVARSGVVPPVEQCTRGGVNIQHAAHRVNRVNPGRHAVRVRILGQGNVPGDNPGGGGAAVGADICVIAQAGIGEVAVVALGAEVGHVGGRGTVVMGCRGHIVDIGCAAGIVITHGERGGSANGVPLVVAVGGVVVRNGPATRGSAGWEPAAAPVRGRRGGEARGTLGLEAQQAVGCDPGRADCPGPVGGGSAPVGGHLITGVTMGVMAGSAFQGHGGFGGIDRARTVDDTLDAQRMGGSSRPRGGVEGRIRGVSPAPGGRHEGIVEAAPEQRGPVGPFGAIGRGRYSSVVHTIFHVRRSPRVVVAGYTEGFRAALNQQRAAAGLGGVSAMAVRASVCSSGEGAVRAVIGGHCGDDPQYHGAGEN